MVPRGEAFGPESESNSLSKQEISQSSLIKALWLPSIVFSSEKLTAVFLNHLLCSILFNRQVTDWGAKKHWVYLGGMQSWIWNLEHCRWRKYLCTYGLTGGYSHPSFLSLILKWPYYQESGLSFPIFPCFSIYLSFPFPLSIYISVSTRCAS